LEHTKRLREICQQTRDNKLFQSDWLDRVIFRSISIYPTRFFLKIGLSPNSITLLSLVPVIVAGALLTFGKSEYWLVAWILLLLYEVLDCSDGEVARYHGLESPVGEYNDIMAGNCFMYPFIRVCMCLGIYKACDNAAIFIVVFTLLIGWIIYWVSPVVCRAIILASGEALEEYNSTKRLDTIQVLPRFVTQSGQIVFGRAGFFLALPIISLLDIFMSPFTVSSLDFNSRFIYMAVIALSLVCAALLRVYDINKHGVRLCE